MKTLENMTNVEKAKLLHQLFPEIIPIYIKYVKEMAGIITNDPKKLKENWKNQLFTVDYWLRLAEHANKCIVQYDKHLYKNKSLFADQLFDGYNAFFAVHCLFQLAENEEMKNSKFSHAIHCLF